MGEAKRRGSIEQRIAQAEARDAEARAYADATKRAMQRMAAANARQAERRQHVMRTPTGRVLIVDDGQHRRLASAALVAGLALAVGHAGRSKP